MCRYWNLANVSSLALLGSEGFWLDRECWLLSCVWRGIVDVGSDAAAFGTGVARFGGLRCVVPPCGGGIVQQPLTLRVGPIFLQSSMPYREQWR